MAHNGVVLEYPEMSHIVHPPLNQPFLQVAWARR